MQPIMHHPVNSMSYVPYGSPFLTAPSPYTDSYVLDLSKKTPPSPDYSHCFPSPKSNSSQDEADLSKCCSPKRTNALLNNTRLIENPANTTCTPIIKEVKSEPIDDSYYSECCPKSPDGYSEATSETSSLSDGTYSPKCQNKIPRPFKILPKDSLLLAFNSITQANPSNLIAEDKDMDPEIARNLIEDSVKKYAEFRAKMLQHLRNNNTTTNKNMRRLQNTLKTQDAEYLEKRRKNNSAAKKSRDARRIKQDELAIRVTFLEQENIMLKYKIKSEKEDLERLEALLSKS